MCQGTMQAEHAGDRNAKRVAALCGCGACRANVEYAREMAEAVGEGIEKRNALFIPHPKGTAKLANDLSLMDALMVGSPRDIADAIANRRY